jgi:hypothetical protein
VSEFLQWCKDCKQLLEEYESVDAREFAPNEVHESAAMLVRLAKMYLRKFQGRELADGFPSMKAKHVTDAIIRFEQCIEWGEECLAGNGATSVGLDIQVLSPAKLRAHQSYHVAEQELLELGIDRVTDQQAYDWLIERYTDRDGYVLPAFETWARYVREARNHFRQNKNHSRTGRTSRSIVSVREIASNRSEPDS